MGVGIKVRRMEKEQGILGRKMMKKEALVPE